MKSIFKWLVYAAVLLLIGRFVPGIEITGLYAALVTVVLLALVNTVIKPLIVVLTLPVNVLTLGLFTFVINALMFWFVATIVGGFSVGGFVPAFIGAFIMTLVAWMVNMFLKK